MEKKKEKERGRESERSYQAGRPKPAAKNSIQDSGLGTQPPEPPPLPARVCSKSWSEQPLLDIEPVQLQYKARHGQCKCQAKLSPLKLKFKVPNCIYPSVYKLKIFH